jgi:hypothetical protein
VVAAAALRVAVMLFGLVRVTAERVFGMLQNIRRTFISVKTEIKVPTCLGAEAGLQGAEPNWKMKVVYSRRS